jgi:hypothetical protein
MVKDGTPPLGKTKKDDNNPLCIQTKIRRTSKRIRCIFVLASQNFELFSNINN